MLSGFTELFHLPIPLVGTGNEGRKAQGYDMPVRYNPIQDVRGDSGTIVHRQRGGVPELVEKTYPLPILKSRTYRRFDDGEHTLYAWDGASN